MILTCLNNKWKELVCVISRVGACEASKELHYWNVVMVGDVLDYWHFKEVCTIFLPPKGVVWSIIYNVGNEAFYYDQSRGCSG